MATNTTTTTGGLSSLGSLPMSPDFQLQALRTVIGQGGSIAAAPYVGYSGPRIAPLTPDQQNAEAMTRNIASGAVIDPNAVSGAISYGLSGFDPEQVKKYMSPYTEGVINELGRLSRQNLFEGTLPGLNTTFAGAGQFGSTRNADFVNRAIRDESYNLLGQQSKALNQAYDTAMSNYNTWHQNALGNAGKAMDLSQTAATNLGLAGLQEQQQQQKSYDLAYQDFQSQRNYPQQQLGWLANIVSGQKMPTGEMSPTYDYTMAQSPLMQGLGTAADIYGTFKTFNT